MDNGALPIVVAALFVLGVVGFAAGVLLDVRALRLVAKPIPVLALAALAGASEGRYARILAAGLALGAVGDVLLEIGPRLFVAGLGAFLIGHVAYVVAFVVEERRARILRAIPPFLLGVGVLSQLWAGLGAMAIPVTVYMLVICAMGYRAGAMVEPGRKGAWLALGGALLFLVSDTLLGIHRFHTPLPAGRVLILATYWLAQLLIALSARALVPRKAA
ncbi:MAG: lysoplasmalogenase [Polyangiaceae bacterium]